MSNKIAFAYEPAKKFLEQWAEGSKGSREATLQTGVVPNVVILSICVKLNKKINGDDDMKSYNLDLMLPVEAENVGERSCITVEAKSLKETLDELQPGDNGMIEAEIEDPKDDGEGLLVVGDVEIEYNLDEDLAPMVFPNKDEELDVEYDRDKSMFAFMSSKGFRVRVDSQTGFTLLEYKVIRTMFDKGWEPAGEHEDDYVYAKEAAAPRRRRRRRRGEGEEGGEEGGEDKTPEPTPEPEEEKGNDDGDDGTDAGADDGAGEGGDDGADDGAGDPEPKEPKKEKKAKKGRRTKEEILQDKIEEGLEVLTENGYIVIEKATEPVAALRSVSSLLAQVSETCESIADKIGEVSEDKESETPAAPSPEEAIETVKGLIEAGELKVEFVGGKFEILPA